MTAQQPQPTPPSPPRPFQFSLRTLLLLFVVLGSSLAVFGGGGVVVFGLAVGLAIYLHRARSFAGLGILLVLSIIPAIDVLGLALAYLLPMISASESRATGVLICGSSPLWPCGCSRSVRCWSARCGAGRPGLAEVAAGGRSLDCPSSERSRDWWWVRAVRTTDLCGAYSPPILGIARVSPLMKARHGANMGGALPQGLRVHRTTPETGQRTVHSDTLAARVSQTERWRRRDKPPGPTSKRSAAPFRRLSQTTTLDVPPSSLAFQPRIHGVKNSGSALWTRRENIEPPSSRFAETRDGNQN